MKKICFTLFFLCCITLTAQNFNKYKYIIVPKKLSIFKEPDKYRTSALIKFLFNKKEYNVVYDDAMPQDLKENGCLGLLVDLIKESNMFTTKVSLTLKDCNRNNVFTTKIGKSKEKEYVKSYSQAIKDAFKSFDGISYMYTPIKEEVVKESVTLNFKGDVKEVGKEPVVTSIKEVANEDSVVQENKTIDVIVEEKEVKQTISKATPVTIKSDASTLYAQEIPNGFQLVDSAPKIRYKIYKTSSEGYFIAEQQNINGVVINKNGNWFFEYYENNQLKSEELKIKF